VPNNSAALAVLQEPLTLNVMVVAAAILQIFRWLPVALRREPTFSALPLIANR
jgi:hypothetical protein